MFTGIIEAVGSVTAIKHHAHDMTISVDSGKLDLGDVKLGDSIAHNGVCLTISKLHKNGYDVDISHETIRRSSFASIKIGFKLNLEKAMQMQSRFGGHFVSGHIDGIGEITSITQLGNAIEYWIKAPAELTKYIAEKGSITIDGISLTTNAIDSGSFRLTIIPHTIAQTTIQTYQVGMFVNLEVDLIARYLERLLSTNSEGGVQSSSTMDLLARSGFLNG